MCIVERVVVSCLVLGCFFFVWKILGLFGEVELDLYLIVSSGVGMVC